MLVPQEQVQTVINHLSTLKAVGLDTETTSLDPHDGKLRLVQLSSPEDNYVFDLFHLKDISPLMSILSASKPVKVMHNAKFDCKWVKHALGTEITSIFDTYIASQLLSGGNIYERHRLEDVVRRYLGRELDKTEQKSDWSGELTESQIAYAEEDVAVMLPLREAMIEPLKNNSLIRVAVIEFECVPSVVDLELNGIFIDQEMWLEQVRKSTIERDRIADELQEMLSAGHSQMTLFMRHDINLNSNPQIQKALRAIGVPVEDSTLEWKIKPLARDYPAIEKLLEYRKYEKQLTHFGENIIEFVNPKTKRIHADFRQIGAPTGRFSCNNPNLQQIPHTDEYRSCFKAEPGNKFIISDYSQIELRILADYSRDPDFVAAFRSGEDLHSVTASNLFDVPLDKVSKEQRALAKNLNFGVVYGIGPKRFSMTTGITIERADAMIKSYFLRYPHLGWWLNNAASEAVSTKRATTKSGRIATFYFDSSDKQQVSGASRNGKNTPIQGTGADILKRALHLLHGRLKGTSGRLVHVVHDEIVIEAKEDEAELIKTVLEEAMKTAGEEFISEVPIEVSTTITDAWVK